ncbi:MAG TPA: hypothetical protein ENJ38_03865 [Rhodospirillales bacterium]|nr:hypothetical protein [Rhodospirillales bacterium]
MERLEFAAPIPEARRVLGRIRGQLESCGPRGRCRHRFCPVCRPAHVWHERQCLEQTLTELRDASPETVAFHVTLTVRTVPLDELRACVGVMGKAFDPLMHRQPFRLCRDYVRRREERLSSSGDEMHANPHFHVLLLAPPELEDAVADEAVWSRHWADCLGHRYAIIVDVRRLACEKAQHDLLRYMTKEAAPPDRPTDRGGGKSFTCAALLRGQCSTGDLARDGRALAEYFCQTRGLRGIAVGGQLRAYFTQARQARRAHWKASHDRDAEHGSKAPSPVDADGKPRSVRPPRSHRAGDRVDRRSHDPSGPAGAKRRHTGRPVPYRGARRGRTPAQTAYNP